MRRVHSSKVGFGGAFNDDDSIEHHLKYPGIDLNARNVQGKALPWSRWMLASLRLSSTHAVYWQSERGVYKSATCCSSFVLYVLAVLVLIIPIIQVCDDFAWLKAAMMKVDTIEGDLAIVFQLLSWVCILCYVANTVLLGRTGRYLAQAFNELQQLWIVLGQPKLAYGGVAFLVSFVSVVQIPVLIFCITQQIFQMIIVQNVTMEFNPTLFAAVYSTATVLSWPTFIFNSISSSIFIFTTYIYLALAIFADHLVTEQASASEDFANKLKAFVRRADRTTTAFHRAGSSLTLSSILAIGATLLWLGFALIVYRVEFVYVGWFVFTVFGSYSAAIVGAVLSFGHFRDKVRWLKSRLPLVASALHFNDGLSAELRARLKLAQRPPTALGFFKVQPGLYVSLVAFLFGNMMLFLQFKTILLQPPKQCQAIDRELSTVNLTNLTVPM